MDGWLPLAECAEEFGLAAEAFVEAGLVPGPSEEAIALQKGREAAHGQIATTFYEFDVDGSGYL